MIGIAGNDAASFAKSDYDAAMRTSLDIGILEYCHVRERRLELLYGSIDGEQAVAKILADARRLAGEF
jgi:NAD(P)H dehydrogenase (quinone)